MKHTKYNLKTALNAAPFELSNLEVTSSVLKNNPLGDSPVRHNFVLAPKANKPLPVIFYFSGYFGNGSQSFNFKPLEENLAESVVSATKAKKIPQAVHVFVDAITGVGGSQFINSEGCGDYSDYIQKELFKAVSEEFNISDDPTHRCVAGVSSGGYGALHHVSAPKSPFGLALAVSPDSHFESSLLPDLHKAAPGLAALASIKDLKAALVQSEFRKRGNFFTTMNALAMSFCYSKMKKGRVQFPINLETGERDEKLWASWLEKDPVYFMDKRLKELKNKFVYLDVGQFDEYCLYFGARRMRQTLLEGKIAHHYSEFLGTHSGLTARLLIALEWLKQHWKN